MKSILLVMLLGTSFVHANELENAWNNYGKGNKRIYIGKALFASCLGYVAARGALEQIFFAHNVFWKKGNRKAIHTLQGTTLLGEEVTYYGGSHDWVGTCRAEMVPRHVIMGGMAGYAAYLCFKQAWLDGKRAYTMYKISKK